MTPLPFSAHHFPLLLSQAPAPGLSLFQRIQTAHGRRPRPPIRSGRPVRRLLPPCLSSPADVDASVPALPPPFPPPSPFHRRLTAVATARVGRPPPRIPTSALYHIVVMPVATTRLEASPRLRLIPPRL
ncbi:hypothetical protein DAEQUDRAFT_726131, partial [Daedalea quercina L-15889]